MFYDRFIGRLTACLNEKNTFLDHWRSNVKYKTFLKALNLINSIIYFTLYVMRRPLSHDMKSTLQDVRVLSSMESP